MRNKWCEILGIDDPDFAEAVKHPEANTYARLILALLEHGAPMSLDDAE